jgi:hypothetical protein
MEFRPSAASRWLNCPGSVPLSEGLPSKASEYAIQGTAAHSVLEQCQRLDMSPWDFVGETITVDEDGVLEAIEVTEEMAEAVSVFLSHIEGMPPGAMIEKFMTSAEFPGLQGTADYLLSTGKGKRSALYLKDYKHGAGVAVSAEGNKQLLTYAVLAFEVMGPHESVHISIIQPRSQDDEGPKVKTWSLSKSIVLEHKERIAEAYRLAHEAKAAPLAYLQPGDHCRWCPAKVACPKLHQLAIADAKADFSFPNPADMARERVLFWLSLAPVMADWLKAIEAHAKSLAEQGEQIPGFKLVQSMGNRRWHGEPEDIADSLIKAGFDATAMYEPRELKSPAQMEKAYPKASGMKAKQAKDIIANLTVRPTIGTRLVPDSDKRDELIKDSPETDFARIENHE